MGVFTTLSITKEETLNFAWYVAPAWIFLNISVLLANGILLAVTIRSKELRNVCNYLIAVQACSDMLCISGLSIMFVSIYTRTFIPITTCFFIQIPFFGALNVSTLTWLVIGVDRLLSTKYVSWYRAKNNYHYFGFMISSVFLYLILIFTISYNTLNDDEVLCFVPDGFTGRGKDFWTLTQVVINISVIVVYAKLKNALKQQGILNSHVTRKIFKSLFMLVAFYICGWVVTITLLVATRVFVQDPNLTQSIEMIIGLAAASDLCVPFIVFYTQSSVYNSEIKKLFGRNKVAIADSVMLTVKYIA